MTSHQPSSQWRERLGTYGLGVLIGVVLVYMIMQARSQSRQAQSAPPPAAQQPPGAPPAPAR